MAYNNYFPQYYPQPTQPQNSYVNSNAGIIWVQGEAGAKSYLVAPNTTVQLWDSEAQVIYLKSADASGMPSMKIIDYTIRDNTPPTQSTPHKAVDYVTKSEFDTFKAEVQKMIGGLDYEPTLSSDE